MDTDYVSGIDYTNIEGIQSVVEPTHSLSITNALYICLYYSSAVQLMFTALFSFHSMRPA